MATDFELVDATDANNPDEWDLRLTNGDLTLVTGRDAIAEHVRQRLQFFFSEWFLDQGLGVPWFQRILVKNVNRAVIRSILRRTIEATPGIVSAEDIQFQITGATRAATIGFTAVSTDGSEIVFTDFQPLVIEV